MLLSPGEFSRQFSLSFLARLSSEKELLLNLPKKDLWDKWHSFFVGCLLFVSPTQQRGSSDRSKNVISRT